MGHNPWSHQPVTQVMLLPTPMVEPAKLQRKMHAEIEIGFLDMNLED